MLIGREAGDDEDRRQGEDHRRAADDQRNGRRHHRAEHEQQGQGRERQRDQLAPSEVGLGDGLDVAVERGAAGQPDLEAGRLVERGAQARAAPSANRRRAGPGGRCRRRCGRRRDTWRVESVCGRTPRTYGAPAARRRSPPQRRPRTPAHRRAPSPSGRRRRPPPRRRRSRSRAGAFACADSRSSRMKPPDAQRGGRLEGEGDGRDDEPTSHASDHGPAVAGAPPPEPLEAVRRQGWTSARPSYGFATIGPP